MRSYVKTIKAGNVLEKEVYESVRRPGKKGIARGTKRAETPEKQKLLNKINAAKRYQRLILNNFRKNDWWLTLILAENLTEEQAIREFDNFIDRFNYRLKKGGSPRLKYIGVVARGEKGGRWHAHVVIPYYDPRIITAIWEKSAFAERVYYKPLYEDGNYKKLAEYIIDNGSKHRLKVSRRNLIPPKVTVREITKKEARALKNGEIPEPPKGYIEDKSACYFYHSDVTGISCHFTYVKFAPHAAARGRGRRIAESI